MATGRPFTALPQRLYVVVVRRTVFHRRGRTIKSAQTTRKIRCRSDGLTHQKARELAALWKKLYCFDKVEIDGPFVKS
jgi:hypothetical protein